MHRVRDLFSLLSIRNVIVVQSVLQVLELRGFDERLRGCFLDVRKLVNFRLRLFMLCFSQLLSQSAYFILGKRRAAMSSNVRGLRNFSFGLRLRLVFGFEFVASNFRLADFLWIGDWRGTQKCFCRQ